jgi:hypothetical protein
LQNTKSASVSVGHAEIKRSAIMFRVALAALSLVMIFSAAAYGLTQQELVAKLVSAGYSQIREIKAGKITTYKAVKSGKEVSLVVDSFGKIKELP